MLTNLILGYYDLRIPEVRDQQAELAEEAGIWIVEQIGRLYAVELENR